MRVLVRQALIAAVLCTEIASLFGSGTQPVIKTVCRRSLTFAERVAYQRAIEEVYWRHRSWPKENPGAKPSLDAVLSRAQVEKKVEDYLQKAQALEDYWRLPITAEQMQSEMDRIAKHTKQPDVLRELFAVLGNDPSVIAECLAGPSLVERLLFESHLHDVAKSVRDDASQSAAGASEASACYTLPDVTAPSGDMNDTWTAISTVLEPRIYHSAIWTGSEMIIWGGYNVANHTMNNGASYNPATDSWTLTSLTNAPEPRSGSNAVWTGSQMIVWGGAGDHGHFNTGGKYNPAADSWTATSTTNAPEPRTQHTAVWTGSELIVWGGFGCGGNCNFNSGGRYNPDTDSWTATSLVNAPSRRFGHTAVWTGNEMIIWSGTDAIPNSTFLRTGGRYNPATDSWMPTSLANVPLGRVGFTAIWTGSEMIVWGGVDETFHDVNIGGRYNPGTDSWVTLNLPNTPSARDSHTAVWTGSEMIIWGGSGPSGYFNTGGRYNPGTDSWTTTTMVNAPMARAEHTAVWTGSEMIVWGGDSDGTFLNSGGSYSAQPSTPTVQSAVSRKSHGDAGNFDVNLPLSGAPGIECRSGGATGDYTVVITFAGGVSMTANPQAAVTSGMGTIGSDGVGNGGMVTISGNVVTIPLTNVGNAQSINVTLNNVNGSTNVTIPMRVLIGDVHGTGTVNSSDVVDTKMCAGQTVSASNFRCDVDAGGAINATDLSVVKSQSGTGLP